MTNAVKYLTLDNPYRHTVNRREVHLLWKYKPGPSQNFDFVRQQLSTALSSTYQNADDNFYQWAQHLLWLCYPYIVSVRENGVKLRPSSCISRSGKSHLR